MSENQIPAQLPTPPAEERSLHEIALFFLRLGTVAFGGPAGHVAMMEDELVSRRRWLTREQFLDLLGASNLIPGPSSSELAIHIGYLLGGFPGLLISGLCFILPAACLVGALAWVYVHVNRLAAAEGVLYGIKPVVIAVVAQALWRLARTAMKTYFLTVIGAAILALAFFGVPPILLLIIGGLAAAARLPAERIRKGEKLFTFAFLDRLCGVDPGKLLVAGTAASTAAAATPVTLGSLFLVFLKIGAVVFGSGYVLLAFLRADLVVHRAWLTDAQLIDAVAIGQVTPGPVFTTATFIGYLVGGVRGALIATVGIFLPAFLLVAASGPIVPRIRQSKTAGAFLDGIIAASVALMAHVGWQLGRASVVDLATTAIALFSAIALLGFRVNSAWLVLLGAVAGGLFRGFGP